MRPVEFAEQTVVIAKDQPQYLPWGLSWRERWLLLWRGKIWHQILAFSSPLQPQLLSVDKPDFDLANCQAGE